MEVKQIKLSEEQIKNLLPETAGTLVNREGSIVFGTMDGKDSENLLALVLISVSDAGDEYILNHMVSLDERGTLSLTDALNEAVVFCKNRGQKRLVCRFIDSQENLQTIHRFMDLVPHKPLVLNGHRLVYGMDDVFPEELLKKHGNLVPLLKQVKTYEEVPRLKYNKFFEKLRQVGREGFANFKDEDFDRYFEYRGDVSGFINTARTAKELLLLADSFVYNREIRQYAYPAMLASVLLKAKVEIPYDGRVILQIYEESFYQGVKTMLGMPSFEEMIFEYVIMF